MKNAASTIGIDISDNGWTRPTEFPYLSNGVKAIDLETNDVGIQCNMGPGWCFKNAANSGRIIGVAIAHESGFRGYYPIGHDDGENFDQQVVFSWLRSVMSGGTVVMHNAGYDLGWLRSVGVHCLAPVFDTYIAATLAQWSSRKHNLDVVATSLGFSGKNKESLYIAAASRGISRDKIMSSLACLPPSAVGAYAEDDAIATLAIHAPLCAMIKRFKLEQVFDLETRVMRAVIAMRAQGVRTDLQGCSSLMTSLTAQVAEQIARVKYITGVDINIWHAESIAAALAQTGFKCQKTSYGRPSVTKELLTGLADLGNDVAAAVLAARQFDKALQFADSIRSHTIGGRIHAEFHALWTDKGGARTGRFSSSNPNLQNIPERNKATAQPIRRLFVPEDGCQWDCFDFASQEPRITVHWACHRKLPRAEDAREQYIRNNRHDFHQWAAGLFDRPRKQAKALFLGTVYCKGGASTCDELGLPTMWVVPPAWDSEVPEKTVGAVRVAGEKGAALRRAFDDELPFVRKLQRDCVQYAQNAKYICTVSGRRVPVSPGEEHKAINYMIQGSAADQMKLAISVCYETGYTPRLTVHDENNFCDLKNDAQRHEIREIMEHCADNWFSVPSAIDLESGPTWGDIA